MFKVVGTDDKEYGPASAEDVRSWIHQGRLNARSRIRRVEDAEWKVLRDLPEFAESLAGQGPGLPPPVPATQGATSGLAIASLVLGGLGLVTFGLAGLVGLVLGIVALVRINKSQGRLQGAGLAITGICISGVMLVFLPIAAALLLPALGAAKDRAQSIQCMNNIKQLNLALMMYAGDHGDRFPPADRWCDLLKPYTGGGSGPFHCVSEPPGRCSYAYNAGLANRKTTDLKAPARTVLVFTSTDGWNQSGGLPAVVPHHHGRQRVVLGFADGHSEVIPLDRLGSQAWQ